LPALTFTPFGSIGYCIPFQNDTAYPNIKFLLSIDKDTIIGADYL